MIISNMTALRDLDGQAGSGDVDSDHSQTVESTIHSSQKAKVGGPLFERHPCHFGSRGIPAVSGWVPAWRYYTRWSWPEDQKPRIFIQDFFFPNVVGINGRRNLLLYSTSSSAARSETGHVLK